MKSASGKVNIVFGINDLMVGGAQKQLIQQVSLLDRSKYDVSVITLFQFVNEPTLYKQLPPDVNVIRYNFKSLLDVKNWWSLYRSLKNTRPDIVASSLFFSNTVFRVLKPLCGYVSIPCEQNTYVEKTRFHTFIDRVLSKISYRIVAVSKTVAEFTSKQQNIPLEKFVVIPNSTDTAGLEHKLERLPEKGILKETLGYKPTDRIILSLGRLVPQKNNKLLIDGFNLFHRQCPDFKLAIVGDGGLRKELEQQVEHLGLGAHVTFFGSRTDVETFYKIGDIFIQTSDIEGFPLVCIEAMACGLPVLSTITAGSDECVIEGANGSFIRERTPEAVAQALITIFEKDLKSYVTAARQTAKNFDVSKNVLQYEHLFDEALAPLT